ncbi:AraC family transcriptional regulator [Pedobacter sp. KBW06]|uniref:DJ-1/PfpI family protein n=1 Tax=Pedobacter sp. KBW06 TaxID=2153359 RepID=UPI000F597F04|nr:DJ-1/PfpI family protein [Pedobacter sp. KBW06]RQO65915.1 AraC family transcriptional regulator [Pedobacter sp. KBW06]
MKRLILALLLFPCLLLAQQPPVSAYVCPPCGGSCDTISFSKAGICPHCEMTLLSKDEKERPVKEQQTTVCFYLYNGVEVLDFAGPMEVFSYAGFKVFTVSKTKEPLISQGILKIIPEYSIADAPLADIFAVFGGNDEVAADDPEVIAWIKSRDQATLSYFSVCTGAFILSKAGLLNNLQVTTFHRSIEHLQKAVPSARVLKNTRYVDNGRIITTAGISAGIDGALHLVAKLKGKEAAMKVAQHMEYDKYQPDQGLVVR